MTRNIYPTYSNSMFEDKFIIFGKDECLYVKEDVEQEELDYMFYCAKKKHKCVCFIKTDITCPRCGKKLHFNGKSPRKWNKKTTIKLQNYIHRDCNISKKASLNKFRDKHCCYTRMIREGATQSALISYRSYQSKKEELNSYYKTQISTSTIYYTEMTSFWKYYRELVKKQKQEIEKQGIKPSGHYSFDEQYIFVSKQLFLRMTIIDIKTKLIIAEKLVNEEEYNDQTIKDFLENNINTETLKSITTDGRKNYKTIISAIGAIHHRCFFHLMQNLMTPLQKHVNKLERKIKTNKQKITKNKEEIERRKQKYTPHKGRIPLKDTKRQNNKNKIKELTDENKKIRQENRNIKKELQTIQTNKERIQKIFKSKTLKQATRRFNTIYNNRKTLHHTFQTFLENMNKDLDLFLNHIENKDIPATNNTVKNYYRTTLPRKHKRIYRTLKGLQKRIKQQQLRWTHRQVLNRKDNIDKNTKYN